MPSFGHILFPVDFSDQSRAMAPHVVGMAARYRARVTMLHVMRRRRSIQVGRRMAWGTCRP